MANSAWTGGNPGGWTLGSAFGVTDAQATSPNTGVPIDENATGNILQVFGNNSCPINTKTQFEVTVNGANATTSFIQTAFSIGVSVYDQNISTTHGVPPNPNFAPNPGTWISCSYNETVSLGNNNGDGECVYDPQDNWEYSTLHPGALAAPSVWNDGTVISVGVDRTVTPAQVYFYVNGNLWGGRSWPLWMNSATLTPFMSTWFGRGPIGDLNGGIVDFYYNIPGFTALDKIGSGGGSVGNGGTSIGAPTVNPSNPVTGTYYTISATKVGAPFVDPQYSSNTVGEGVSFRNATSPIVQILSNNGYTVSFGPIEGGSVLPHQAVVQDVVSGSDTVVSPVTPYNVLAASGTGSAPPSIGAPTVSAATTGALYSISAVKFNAAFVNPEYSSDTVAEGIYLRAASGSVTASLSTTTITNDTVTFSGIEGGTVGTNNHVAYVADNDNGLVISPGTTYSVVAVGSPATASILATTNPSPVISGEPYQIIGTMTGGTFGPNPMFSSQAAPLIDLVTAGESPYWTTVTLAMSEGNTVATFSGVQSGNEVPHIAVVSDPNGTGAVSPETTYDVVAPSNNTPPPQPSMSITITLPAGAIYTGTEYTVTGSANYSLPDISGMEYSNLEYSDDPSYVGFNDSPGGTSNVSGQNFTLKLLNNAASTTKVCQVYDSVNLVYSNELGPYTVLAEAPPATQSILCTVSPNNPASGATYSIIGQAVGFEFSTDTSYLKYSNQQSQNPTSFVNATSPVTCTVTTTVNTNDTVTFAGITSGSADQHTAIIQYSPSGGAVVTSDSVAFTV
jgi:2-keto-3-deoxy-6-phosphogluconate aldolase